MSRQILSNLKISVLPADARVAVEGGHFTLRWQAVAGGEALEPKKAYFFKTSNDAPPAPFELRRGADTKDPDCSWVAVEVPGGEKIRAQDLLPHGEVWTFESPRGFELSSLERAMEIYGELKGTVAQIALTVLIGDLRVPAGLRRSAGWALPRAFRKILAQIDQDDVCLLSEATCQNRGDQRILKLAARYSDDSNVAGRIYEKFGYGVFKTGKDSLKTFYLMADWLLKQNRGVNAVAPLTKYDGHPCCGVTLAGKLLKLNETRTTHHIAFYDSANDPYIRQKCLDGAVIASYFEPGFEINSTIVVHQSGKTPTTDIIHPRELRQAGQFKDITELFCATSVQAPYLGFEVLDMRISNSCCTDAQTEQKRDDSDHRATTGKENPK